MWEHNEWDNVIISLNYQEMGGQPEQVVSDSCNKPSYVLVSHQGSGTS